MDVSILELRKLTGLSQKAFGKKYGIPWRTVQNWENEVSTPPGYVITLLERCVKEDYSLDKDMYALIPTWLVEIIMETKRINGNGEEYNTYLFAPDASEVFGPDECWYEARYERLHYYEKAYHRMKVDLKDEDQPVFWWTASAYSGGAAGAVCVYANGMSYGTGASYVYGVPVCFRINAADLDGLIREALNSGGTVRRVQEVKL